MSNETITARVFTALNENPDITIEELEKDDKRSTVTAARNFWRKTRHKIYMSSSSVSDPVETARKTLLRAAKQGLTEAQGRDLAIDAGVAHGTAFAVAAQVYRDFRRQQPNLKGSRGSWTVVTENGLEIPVCHNIRVDWTQNPPHYNDAFKKVSKKYEHWLLALKNGYAVIQKGKVEEGVETRARDSYLGIYRIDQLKERLAPDGKTATVTFRLLAEESGVPKVAITTGGMRVTTERTDDLRNALLTIAYRAERTTKQSGKETTTISKWKEFGFQSADAMADHLEGLYHRQEGLCALSGVRMTLTAGEWCVSPDRIDSNGHYTPDNLQLVANCVNMMKGATPNDQFLVQLETIKKVGS
ncbi:hypothetical protein [Paracoccus alkanivorans]|uniref:Uncharacterized protein n=1 Tax=Paracoccus alkanivorans TaxID=2116655 RepID=A0A3M0M3L9_9RHOB|nr:hypothetical protein [Paracoccus alkanivorans]RMC30030.1 hypothetical protein C9E81_22120 [Paracoccus alkanivorans]